MEIKPVGATLTRCQSFDTLNIVKQDGRLSNLTSGHDHEIPYDREEWTVHQVTEADVRNLIKDLQAIADKTWPVKAVCDA